MRDARADDREREHAQTRGEKMSFEHKAQNRNLFENFRAYPFGFDDFGKWRAHHIEMHKRHPLECAEFGAEWLWRWSEVGRLLETPGYGYIYGPGWRKPLGRTNARIGALLREAEEQRHESRIKVHFLDGTIAREWGANGT